MINSGRAQNKLLEHVCFVFVFINSNVVLFVFTVFKFIWLLGCIYISAYFFVCVFTATIAGLTLCFYLIFLYNIWRCLSLSGLFIFVLIFFCSSHKTTWLCSIVGFEFFADPVHFGDGGGEELVHIARLFCTGLEKWHTAPLLRQGLGVTV